MVIKRGIGSRTLVGLVLRTVRTVRTVRTFSLLPTSTGSRVQYAVSHFAAMTLYVPSRTVVPTVVLSTYYVCSTAGVDTRSTIL